jgi:hypothetical protein
MIPSLEREVALVVPFRITNESLTQTEESLTAILHDRILFFGGSW